MKKVAIIVIIIIIAWFGLRFLSGDEDTWLCQNKTWVKHGQPSAAMPTALCK